MLMKHQKTVIIFIAAIIVVIAATISYRAIHPWVMDYRKYRLLSQLASEGDAGEQRLLAEYLYEKGDDQEALKWISKAAEGGDSIAQNFMGYYYAGSIKDQPPQVDFTIARDWFEKAAAQDFPTSQFELCEMYHRGEGVQQDLETAYFWCSLSEKAFDVAARRKRSLGETLDEEARHRVEHRLTVWKESHRKDRRP
jgi:TPR repeat protein